MKIRCEDECHHENTRPWTIRDISDDTRQAVIRAARREGMTISHWVNRTLDEQAHRVLNQPRFPQTTAASTRSIMDELVSLQLRMDRMEQQTPYGH